MITKQRVLFVCVHNSGRSQMAEAFLKKYGGEHFDVESAGIEPGRLNVIVVKAMQEIGIDISGNKTKDVFDFLRQGKSFNFVITVCDAASGERCPLFPGVSQRLQWSFDDPSAFTGTENERLARTRIVRDQIKSRILEYINSSKVKAS